jgi:uncharacterized protein YndB with AHSA1/START domain
MALWKPDPKLDLVLERIVDVPRELVWAAWTKPEHIVKWFTPAPWTTTHCEIDLRPGGKFHTIMRSPEGKDFPNTGCYLEVVPNERLVWTDALLPGYRPAEKPFFTAIIALEKQGKGTRYTATAIHRDEAGKKQHEEMGFHNGWGTALDQLVAHIRTLAH